jgi:hypothetical protein
MRVDRQIVVSVAAALSVAAIAGVQRQTEPTLSPQALAAAWDAEHVSPPLAPLLTHADVTGRLEELSAAPDLFRVEKAGESVEGRAINHVRVGRGPMPVLLWSQMHGDEPTATAALLDIFEYIRRHRTDPMVATILSNLTLHAVPMLNPDGAERFQRRNAQSLDINRDALRLQTPEGRILKTLRDRLQPKIGFNLHNQSWRTSVGSPPKPATISLLSVAYDDARSENEGRVLTKKLCAVIRDSLEPFAPGQVGRYDDEFEVRAFGDNLTLWGTPVVLIETGAYSSDDPDAALVRLNFIAILTALDALATGRVERASVSGYESLPVNQSRLLSVIVKEATVIAGTGVPPFVADIGLGSTRRVRTSDGRRQLQVTMGIDDLGDLRTLGALRTIEAKGMIAIPLADETLEPGTTVDLPEWKSRNRVTIEVGRPARLALLRPAAEPGKYRVEVVLK